MNRKFAQRRTAELTVLGELSHLDGWVCAKDLSKRLGWPWRVVARALRRAAAMGEVESKEELLHRQKCRTDVRWLYRRKLEIQAFPSWLEPRVTVEVRGRLVTFD